MSAQTLLISLFQYKAWADKGLMMGLTGLGEHMPGNEYDTALRLLDHAHIVDRIFAANLQGMRHSYTATEADEIPQLADLFKAIGEIDQWYVEYVAGLASKELIETITFTFTDGASGRMSREEMLAHVIAHSGYHRGEVGRIITQLTGSSPRDTFTGYLHEVRPARPV